MSRKFLTPEERRQRTHQEMVDNILAIAREMMQADGVAALNFNGIARRLGLTPPALYTYFDSKHAIYDTLFRLGFKEFGRRMRRQMQENQTAYEHILGAIEGYLAFAQENPDLYQLMMQRPVPGFVPSDESMSVSLSVLQEGSEILRNALAETDVEPNMPLEEARDLLFAMTEGLTNLHLANNPELPVGQGRFGKLTTRAARLFLDAWQPKDSGASPAESG